MQFEGIGKILILSGIIFLIVGAIIILSSKLGLGKLPGDIFIKNESFTFYFPLVTSIIISIILTIIFNLFSKR
ncbi:MAG: DUF2905 domain-containing protein [Deltaproteobacteria bacterium]